MVKLCGCNSVVNWCLKMLPLQIFDHFVLPCCLATVRMWSQSSNNDPLPDGRDHVRKQQIPPLETRFIYIKRTLSSMWRRSDFQVHTAASHQGVLTVLSYSQCAEAVMGNRHKTTVNKSREEERKTTTQSKKRWRMSESVSRVFEDLTANKTNIQAAADKQPEPVPTVWSEHIRTLIKQERTLGTCRFLLLASHVVSSVCSVGWGISEDFSSSCSTAGSELLPATTPAEHKHSPLHCLNRGGVAAASTRFNMSSSRARPAQTLLLLLILFVFVPIVCSDGHFVSPEDLWNQQTHLLVHLTEWNPDK